DADVREGGGLDVRPRRRHVRVPPLAAAADLPRRARGDPAHDGEPGHDGAHRSAPARARDRHVAAMTEISVGTLADESMLRGALLERARRAGLDHVFVADHVSFHTGFGMDGLVQAATVAALEPELAIHIGVYLLALRHPVPVARQIATLCGSAPGRLVLGV